MLGHIAVPQGNCQCVMRIELMCPSTLARSTFVIREQGQIETKLLIVFKYGMDLTIIPILCQSLQLC